VTSCILLDPVTSLIRCICNWPGCLSTTWQHFCFYTCEMALASHVTRQMPLSSSSVSGPYLCHTRTLTKHEESRTLDEACDACSKHQPSPSNSNTPCVQVDRKALVKALVRRETRDSQVFGERLGTYWYLARSWIMSVRPASTAHLRAVPPAPSSVKTDAPASSSPCAARIPVP
jgi:hypothetical protein